jgi:hypothetical protein
LAPHSHPNVVAETLALIKRVIDNVINNLDDPKYREVKIKAKPFQKSIIPVDGALDFLIECGFVKRVISFEECVRHKCSWRESSVAHFKLFPPS